MKNTIIVLSNPKAPQLGVYLEKSGVGGFCFAGIREV